MGKFIHYHFNNRVIIVGNVFDVRCKKNIIHIAFDTERRENKIRIDFHHVFLLASSIIIHRNKFYAIKGERRRKNISSVDLLLWWCMKIFFSICFSSHPTHYSQPHRASTSRTIFFLSRGYSETMKEFSIPSFVYLTEILCAKETRERRRMCFARNCLLDSMFS